MTVGPVFLGVDPGLGGAIACLQPGRGPAEVFDAPVYEREKRRHHKPRAMAQLVRSLIAEADHVTCYIEDLHAMPENGSIGGFVLGESIGIWVGVLAGVGVRYDRVASTRWKGSLGLLLPRRQLTPEERTNPEAIKRRKVESAIARREGKERARLEAIRLFPTLAAWLDRKKDEGRAEALLIAEYGRRAGGKLFEEEIGA